MAEANVGTGPTNLELWSEMDRDPGQSPRTQRVAATAETTLFFFVRMPKEKSTITFRKLTCIRSIIERRQFPKVDQRERGLAVDLNWFLAWRQHCFQVLPLKYIPKLDRKQKFAACNKSDCICEVPNGRRESTKASSMRCWPVWTRSLFTDLP